MGHLPYLYDTNITTLETGQGCGEVSGSLYRISEGVYGVDIPLSRTLALGDTHTLEYWTSYHYPGKLNGPQEAQFRRAPLRLAGPSPIRAVVSATASAAALCSLTTTIGSSSLLLSRNLALRSFGLLADLGEITCLVAALVALPSLVRLFSRD